MMFTAVILLVCSLFAGLTYAVDQTRDPALDISLENAPTALDRLALLPNDSDWLFDFRGLATNLLYFTHGKS